MIIDSGWDFLSLAQLQWTDDFGHRERQFVVFGDHHWWFYGSRAIHGDRVVSPEDWTEEVLNYVDDDHIRYIAVVIETINSRLDYSDDAYPFDERLRERAAERGIHHMGSYFLGPEYWSATGPMKTFSTYVGSDDYPTVVADCAKSSHDRCILHA